MFGDSEINEIEFTKELSRFGKPVVLKKSKNILVYVVNGIKVDFVNYSYPLLENIKTIDSIRLVSQKDIGAMKLNAISGRGSKKDFIDLYFLLKTYSLSELFKFYAEKYKDGSEFLVLKSLSYFEDADPEAMPVMTEYIKWEKVKHFIMLETAKMA